MRSQSRLLLNGVPNVQVFDVLLGEAEGTADLFVSGNTAHASMRRAFGAKPVTRPITTLDAILQKQSIPPPTFIKLDVEGSELSVLRGAPRTLREHQPYLLFEADENMNRFGYSKGELFDLIRGAQRLFFYDVQCDPKGTSSESCELKTRQCLHATTFSLSRATARFVGRLIGSVRKYFGGKLGAPPSRCDQAFDGVS